LNDFTSPQSRKDRKEMIFSLSAETAEREKTASRMLLRWIAVELHALCERRQNWHSEYVWRKNKV
jgi:hypothetical protein